MYPFPLLRFVGMLIGENIKGFAEDRDPICLLVIVAIILSMLGPALAMDLCFFLPASIILAIADADNSN